MDREEAARTLVEYNRWRRGQGEYAWSEDPLANREAPCTCVELGKAIDVAVQALRGR